MLLIEIDRDNKSPLIRQIITQLKSKIHSGELPGNFKLPSTRVFANQLKVSRNVVVEVYEQLSAEGYIVSKVGDGSYITKGLVLNCNTEPPTVKQAGFKNYDKKVIDFRSGLPDLSCFPINKWLKVTKEVYKESSPLTFAYRQPEGEVELREAITNYIRAYRGVKCHRDQIIITGGTTRH